MAYEIKQQNWKTSYKIDAKSAKGQAGQMFRAVNREARKLDMPETAIMRKDGRGWQVTWEDGPYEWAVIGGMGGNIWGEEMGYDLYDRRLPQTFEFAKHVYFEHWFTFDFTFYPEE